MKATLEHIEDYLIHLDSTLRVLSQFRNHEERIQKLERQLHEKNSTSQLKNPNLDSYDIDQFDSEQSRSK